MTEILPPDWNTDNQSYSVKYTKDSKGYELKVLAVDEHLMINLARVKDERFASITISPYDHVINLTNDFDR